MLTNNIFKTLSIVFILYTCGGLTFAGHHQYSRKKNISVYDTVPCFLNIKLSGYRLPPSITIPNEYMLIDSIGYVKENFRKNKNYDNITYVYYKTLHKFRIYATLKNTSNEDTVLLESPTGQHGAFQFELFKVTQKGNHKIYFSNIENEAHRYYTEMILPGDTINTYIASLHLGPNNNGLDTGEYIIRCFYKQNCNNKVTMKHSNDVHFCVIN
jgi:hypothetical protein